MTARSGRDTRGRGGREAPPGSSPESVLEPRARPLPWEPSPYAFSGVETADGRFLTFRPHRDCPCADCRAALGRSREVNDAA